MNIQEALDSLDTENDDLWTDDGLPLVEEVEKLVGEKLTRREITTTEPDFNREKARGKKGTSKEQKPEPEQSGPPPEAGTGQLSTETPPEPTTKEELIDYKIRELDELINALVEDRNGLQSKIDGLQRQRDSLQSQVFAKDTSKRQMEDRLKYLETQNRLRMEKAERRKAFVNAGFSIKDLDIKSPLDRKIAADNIRKRKERYQQMKQKNKES